MRSNGTIMARAAVGAGALLVTTLAAQAPQVPADFALRLVGGLCTGDTIDTFSETAWLQIPAPRHTITVRPSGVEHTVR
jgi:uncharacterized membrane protein YjjB (DUF3815 family)